MALFDNDRWVGRILLRRNTRYLYTIEAWRDLFASWRGAFIKKRAAGQPLALELCMRMWRDDQSSFAGKRFRFERPLNRPQTLSRPRPRIMIGGSGEQKTLRLVAKYADACNLFPTPDVQHKLDVLKEHCEREKRNYDDIEKTCMFHFDLGERGENIGPSIERLKGLAKIGFTAVMGGVKEIWKPGTLDRMTREVLPAVRGI